MQCSFRIYRSKEWLAAQRLASGDNVPESVEVEVEIGQLTEKVRQALLACNGGRYPVTCTAIGYDRQYAPGVASTTGFSYSKYGHERLLYDGDAPTAAELSDAITAALCRIADCKREADDEAAKRKVDEEARKAAEEQRQAELAAAREVLAEEWQALVAERAAMEDQRDTLVEFLEHIPQDAKRGALRALAAAQQQSAIADLQKAIEGASPAIVVFETEEEDDDEYDD